MAWIRWTCLLLIGGCCHLGGHDAGDDDDVDAPPTGCAELEPTHEGHDVDAPQDDDERPCDGGTEP